MPVPAVTLVTAPDELAGVYPKAVIISVDDNAAEDIILPLASKVTFELVPAVTTLAKVGFG
jgi:hypothetical protein